MIDCNSVRGTKSADLILCAKKIYACLAPMSTVDLGHESCRHLDISDAPHVYRSGKSSQVADRAAAENNYDRFPVKPVTRKIFEQLFKNMPLFCLFAVRNENDRRL